MPGPVAACKLLKMVRKIRPDLYHGWMYHGNLAASFAAGLSGAAVPVVWNIRYSLYDLKKERHLRQYFIRAGAWWSQWPAAIIYNTRVGAAQHEVFGYSSEKTMIIPNGFDVYLFRQDPDARCKIRSALGVSANTVFIGLIAR